MSKVVRSKRYGESEVERGLLALASENGRAVRASELLRKDGLKIPSRTLGEWRRKVYADRYEQVRDEILPRVRAESAAEHRALERSQLELSTMLVEHLKSEVPTMETRDKINALGKSDIGTGIHAEKAQLLDGEPTHRVGRNPDEILRALAAMGFSITDAPVAEVIDAVNTKELEPLEPLGPGESA
jgi:hypothetical protein